MAKVYALIAAFFLSVKAAFDIRLVFFFGGFGMLFHGLYLRQPWIAWTVCGVLLMALGYLTKANK
jgi:hypothetical protein